MKTSKRSEFFGGIKDELPILVGVIPFGLIYGVSALSMGIPAIVVQSTSFVIFAGSAQFISAQLIGAGAPGIVIILTAFIVNLRHALYSASVAPHVKKLHPLWKCLLAYLLTDEAYAVTITHYNQPGETTFKHWYFLGSGLALWSCWQLSTGVGILLGAQVPASWSLDFTAPLTFIALVVPALKDRASTFAALTAGIVAVLATSLPFKLGIVAAAMVGMLVGLFSDSWLRKVQKD